MMFYNLIKNMLGKQISDMMTARKAPVFETPEKYNLDYENVTFITKDNVTLSGWLIKGGNEKPPYSISFWCSTFKM